MSPRRTWIASEMTQVPRSERLPKNYRLIYDVVCALGEGEHASAGEIHVASRQQRPGLGYSTVYRALDRLRELGLVLEVRVPGIASALYEAARANHAHFRCTTCGGIEDIHYTLPLAEIAGVGHRNGIAISDALVTFNGTCRSCRGATMNVGVP